jgi:PAS domain S-box-containing protein
MDFLDCQVFFNFLADEGERTLRLNAFAGVSAAEAAGAARLDYGAGVCGAVARDRRRVVAEDIADRSDPQTDLVRSWGAQAYCCHPLMAQDRLIGTLSFGTRTRPRFSPEQVEVMKVVSDLVAMAMQRVETEAALRQSRGDLARAQSVGQIGSWRLDVRRNVLTWSDETYRIFGVPAGTPLTYEAFLEIVHPDDRRLVSEGWSAGLGGEPYDVEHRIVVDGRVKWIREKAFFERDEAGTLLGGFGIAQDVTERKNTEALRQALAEQERLRLGAAVEQASEAVVMLDLDGTIRYVNAAFEAINRIGRDAAAGRSYFELIAGGPAEAAAREALAKGLVWHGPVTRPVADGRPVELEITISPAKDPAGVMIGGLVTEKDVTRENALQKQFRQAQKMEALGTLAGGITHDFNNILGAVVINTELALMDLEPGHPARAVLPSVLQAAGRGKELVKQIITFSRQREWVKARLEIAPVVKDTMSLLRSTLPKDLVIHEAIAPDCGVVLGDPSQIHQIVVNLCQNAALAIREGGGTLDVKLEPVAVDADMAARHPDLKPGRYVRLVVADSGGGMSPETMERIFEPFFTTRGHGGGSGLGLPVVLGIVKSYNGAIVVYSEPGKGSVFSVYIPRLEGEAPAAEPPRLRGMAGAGERILFVEDEPAQRASLARSLTKLGYRVAARASGRSALSLFRKDPAAFDVLITDQTMPGLSGLDLAAAVRKVRPDIPVILCTGFSEKVNRDSVEHAGVREYLMKPFTLQEISRLIARALGKAGDEDRT